jgi:hypothetical protein
MKTRIFFIAILFGAAVTIIFISAGASSAEVVAVWLMDEGSGEEIGDASGNGHTGDFFGDPGWDDGKFGKGVLFHGAPDHIEAPDPDHELTPPNITLMAWIKLDNISGTHSILEQYDWAGDLGTHVLRTNGANVEFNVIWGVEAPLAGGGTLTADEWIHVAGTYDGADLTLWIDGEKAGEGKDPQKRALNPSNKSLSFGVRGDTKDIHWMQGIIDEAAIFDEALSQNEIKNIMDNGLQSAVLAVSSSGKLATAWGRVKSDK